MDLPPAKRKNTFGLSARPSFELEGGDVEMHPSLSPEPEEGGPESMNMTPSPPRVPKQADSNVKLPLFLPSSESSPEPKKEFGMPSMLPMPPPSPEPKKVFGMPSRLPMPLPSPEPKKAFGLPSRLPMPLPSPMPKKAFGLPSRLPMPLPSSELKKDFGMRSRLPLPLPSSEPKKKDFGMHSRLPKHDYGLRMAASSSPLLHAKDFRVFILEEEPSQLSNYQPTEAEEFPSSSSKSRTWIWGEPVPSFTTEEVERTPEPDASNPGGMTIQEQAYLLETVYDKVSDVFLRENILSDLLGEVDQDLKDAEVLLNL